MYVQPLFLQGESAAIPELTRVIVATGERVVMAEDLDTALERLFGEEEGSTETSSPGGVDEGVSADADRAAGLYDRAIAAQRAGDWAAYGQAIDELGRVLDRLAGAETTVTP